LRILSLPYRIAWGRPELLPLCDVYLIGPKERVRVTSVVDSGALCPVFPLRAAEDAGIVLPASANCSIQYGGSVTLGRRVRVYIELKHRRWDTEIIFVEKLDLPYGLLGRQGVFGQFNEVAFLERIRTPRVELRW
jgi:hypothetical protein